jgi:molecular chaperone Hsp33
MMSEQIPTLCRYETVLHPISGEGKWWNPFFEDLLMYSVVFSGGVFIQTFPNKKMESLKAEIESFREKIDNLPSISHMYIEENKSLQDIIDTITPDEIIKESGYEKTLLDFFCRCSRDKYRAYIKAMGEKEVRELQKLNTDGTVLTCHFCNEGYKFDTREMEDIAREISHSERLEK